MDLTSLPIADLCLRGSALLALAALLTLALRKRSASSRHLVWLAGLGGLALIPALILVLPAWNILPLPTTTPEHLPQVAPASTLDLPSLPIPEIDLSTTSSVEQAETNHTPSWPAIALAVWGTVTAYLLLRLLASFLAVILAKRCSQPVDPGTQALVNSLAQKLGIARTITAYREEERTMPMSCGLWRGAIILPLDSADWDEPKLKSVLLHELAHHKRRDPLIHAGAQFVRALHWFNPLVWFAWARLNMERERACDDLAIASGLVAPLEYARHFVSVVAGSSTQHQFGLALGEHTQLQERLKAILNNHHIRKPVSKPMNTICLTVTIALALPVALLNAAPPETTKEQPPAPKAEESPKVTSQTNPEYPPRLRKRGVSGKVLLSATINPDGTIGKVNVKESSGHKAMDKAALEAFSKWKFKPATRNGKPIESKTEQPFVFQAEGKDRENHPLTQALKLFQEGDLKKAEAKLKSAIKQGLETPRAHHTLGLIYAQQARWHDAKTQLEAAVAGGYQHRNTDLLLGHACLQLGNLHDAEKHAQLALKRDQASAEAHSLHIHCLLQQNDWPDALKACRSALAIVKDDKLKATYSRLAANASLSMKDYAEAANFLRNSLHFNPDQKETQQLLQKLDQFVEGR